MRTRIINRTDEERNALAVQWGGLVPWCMRRLRHVPAVSRYADECRSAGFETLLRAAALWDETRGVKFSTYAAACVRKRVIGVASRMARRSHLLFGDLAGYEGRPFDVAAPGPCESGLDVDRGRIDRALARLHPRYARVLALYYGLGRQGGRTLAEVAAALGVGKGRAWQIKRLALIRVRRELRRLGQDDAG